MAELGKSDPVPQRIVAVLVGWLDVAVRESDTKVACGRVTKHGLRLLRWALTAAIQRIPRGWVTGGVTDVRHRSLGSGFSARLRFFRG